VTVTAPVETQPKRGRSEASVARRENLGRLFASPGFAIGITVILIWSICALFGEHFVPRDPLYQFDDILARPSSRFLFGTDQLGRDVFSRVITGATDTLKVAPMATLLGVAGGAVIGLFVGYFGGVVDDITGRIIDALLALPLTIVAITVLSGLGASNKTLIVVIGFTFSIVVSRTVRAAVLGERELEYVQAAQLRGERAPYIMFVEILPNVMGPIVVEATVRLGYAIFTVAALTFLGFGVQPPSPDWSLQVADNYTLLLQGDYWWTVLPPSFAIATLVIAVNLVADAIQGVVDR
jgi:peptide/nickel transport system permease protein